MTGPLMVILTKDFVECFEQQKRGWGTVWVPMVPTSKGMEGSLSYVLCFLDLVSSSINVSIFRITWLDKLA